MGTFLRTAVAYCFLSIISRSIAAARDTRRIKGVQRAEDIQYAILERIGGNSIVQKPAEQV